MGLKSLRARAPREASEWKAKKFLWVSLAVTTGSIIFFFALRVVFPTIKEEATSLKTLSERLIEPRSVIQRLKEWGGFTVQKIEFEWRVPPGKDQMLVELKTPRDNIVREANQLKGLSLWGLDLASTQAKIEASGWIESVSLRRQLPGQLQITASLREPRFLIRADGAWIVADTAGNFMFRQKQIPGWLADLPLVFGWETSLPSHSSLAELEKSMLEERSSLKEVHDLVQALEGRLQVQVETVQIEFDEWIERPRFVVTWGSERRARDVRVRFLSGSWKTRLESLQSLLSEPFSGEDVLEVDGQREDRWIVRGGKLD